MAHVRPHDQDAIGSQLEQSTTIIMMHLAKSTSLNAIILVDSFTPLWRLTTHTVVTTAYVIITVFFNINRLRNKKSTAYVITTSCVIKN